MGRQSSIDSYDITVESEDSCSKNSLLDDRASSSDQSIGSDKSFVRNKVKYEESILKMQEIMARRLERVTQYATYTDAVEEETEADDILQLLSSLQQTNNQNEITIQNLQRQLVDLATERDATNKKSHKLEKIMARHRAKHETELSQERKKFADICSKHIEEAQVLKWKVGKLGKRCKRTEAELKKRPGLEQKLIDLENKCTRMESRPKKNTTKRVPTESTGTNSTASSTETPTGNLVRDKSRDEDNEISSCIPELIDLSSSELKDETLMKSDLDNNQEPDSLQDLREENEALYESIEEAMQLSHYVNKKMEGFVQEHAQSVNVYEHRLAALQTKLDNANKSNAEMSWELCSWKKEVEVLTHGLEEEVEVMAHALEKSKAAEMNMTTLKEKAHEQELIDMATLKEDACRDKMEAYAACKVLQVEINLLRKQVMRKGSQDGDTHRIDDQKDMDQESSLCGSRNPSTSDYESLENPKYSILWSILSHDGIGDYDDVSDSIITNEDEGDKTEEEQSLMSI